MGWDEWPLMIFTVTAQAATGAFWWCCLAFLAGGLAPEHVAQLESVMIAIWAMMVFAFAAAAFHLGSPLRGINASFRFGRSHFSNEVVFGSAFVGFGFLGWLMAFTGMAPAALQILVLVLAALCSLAFLASMTAFYMMPTVPTWNTPLTPAAYLVTTLIGGSVVAATLFAAAGLPATGLLYHGPVIVAALSLVTGIVVTLLQSARLPKIRSTIKEAAALSPHFAPLMAARFVILFIALAIWQFDAAGGGVTVASGILCVLLVLVGEMVGRGVHYGLHMTVGLR